MKKQIIVERCNDCPHYFYCPEDGFHLCLDIRQGDPDGRLLKSPIWDYVGDIEIPSWCLLDNHNENADRFLRHLDRIAGIMMLDWWDGDFPIDDFKKEIDRLRG